MNRFRQAGALLERDEAGRVCGADSGLAVLDRLVRDAVLCQVAPNHVWLDLDLRITTGTAAVRHSPDALDSG